ncbi:MAG: cytochrome c oxidase subunit 3 family protein [Bacteroidota bacterium]
MAVRPTTITVDDPHAGHAGGHHGDGAGRPPHLKHYFVSSEQQFDAAKLGMWLFLVTEILLFGGMFVAYGIYRSMYPELFSEASTQLDTVMGALNTIVLLGSSLTVAWSIRAIQMNNKKLCFWLLVTTIVLAGMFMVVKYFEYTHKFELGILPGQNMVYAEGTTFTLPGLGDGNIASGVGNADGADPGGAEANNAGAHAAEGTSLHDLAEAGVSTRADLHAEGAEHGYVPGEHGLTNQRAGLFFSIYYVMTGIHGLHVLIGMVAIGILAVKTWRGKYSDAWYTPVENVGLYWHVVDVIWIFLFPLMYLI